MKRVFSMLCLLLQIGISKASAQTLVLHHANGTTTDVELLTQPQVKFQNNMVFITSTVLKMEYPKEDVLTITYKGKATGIKDVKGNVSYTQKNGLLVFHGIKSTEGIAIYNAKGVRIPVSIRRSGDDATFSLSSIPSGVYLLNVNGKTSKFTKP